MGKPRSGRFWSCMGGHGVFLLSMGMHTDEGVRVEQCRAWERHGHGVLVSGGQGDMGVRGGKKVR